MRHSEDLSVSYDMEVPFYDVDSYRIVWHGNYPKYFEIGRCGLLEEIGYPYEKMEEAGTFFPVIDLRVKYVLPILFKQKIRIESRLKSWEHKLTIDYRISDRDNGQVLTKAQTSQVAVKMPEQITLFQSPKPFVDAVEAWRATKV